MTRVLITAMVLLFCVTVAAAATGIAAKVTDPDGHAAQRAHGPMGRSPATLANGALVSITNYADECQREALGGMLPTTRRER